jgi:hypothetical protein
MIINYILWIFLYALVGNIVYKVLNKKNRPLIENPIEFFAGLLWFITIPVLLAHRVLIHVIDPLSNKIIKIGKRNIESFCKNKKDRNID